MDQRYAVGADIGGSHICSSVVDLSEGRILENTVVSARLDSFGDSASRIIDIWSGCIAESIARSGMPVGKVGIAIPGPFDYQRGICIIEGVDKYEALFGLDVTESLLSKLYGTGVRDILYTNDASAFALGEMLGGAARHTSRVIALTIGTGFGSGFIADGRLVTGGDSVPANGWVYCLPYEGGIADDKFSTRWFVGRYRELTGVAVDGVREIAQMAGSDNRARQVFEEYGQRLADFILPLYRKFGADAVVLGGNISKAHDLFGDSFRGYLSGKGESIDLRISSLGDGAAMTGAASLFLDR